MGYFPVPRHELPQVRVSHDEHHGRKAQMQRMLKTLVDDYERYVEGSGREVDKRLWKATASRGRLKLYKERDGRGAVDAHSSSEFDCGSDPDELAHTSPCGRAGVAFSEEGADNMRMTLMVGECTGRVENAMHAVIAANHFELALVDIFLHEDVADCALLHTMEGPTAEDACHFLGYKWFVRRSPTSSHLLRHRDSVYVESSGLTRTRAGEELGYHIMHSVDLADFPEMRDRHCLRTSQSIRALYRQRAGNVVEVFILGNLQLSGMLKGPIATMFIQATLFNMPKVIDCGEAKRLTSMVQELRPLRDRRIAAKLHGGEICELCRQPKKRFGAAIGECDVCGLDVCGKCRLGKRVFQSNGVLGHFYKITVCKTCVVKIQNPQTTTGETTAAASSPPSAPAKMTSATTIRTMAEQREIRHRSASAAITASVSSDFSLLFEEAPASPRAVRIRAPSRADDGDGDDKEKAASPARGAAVAPLTIATSPLPFSHPSTRSPETQSVRPGQSTVAQSTPVPATASAPATPQADLYMKMLELQRQAQQTYQLTQQNKRLFVYDAETNW